MDLEVLNFVFTIVFSLEMAAKMGAEGVRAYMKSNYNKFDALIVFLSFLELAVAPPSFMSSSSSEKQNGLSSLRTFRLFRIFKLARSWREMQRLLLLIMKTCNDIMYFALLLALFMYIYSLLGMQFFANRLAFDEYGYRVRPGTEGYKNAEVPRSHFDTLLWAFMTVFQILTGENWNTVMYDGWRAQGIGGVFYFVTLIVFGQMIVMCVLIWRLYRGALSVA